LQPVPENEEIRVYPGIATLHRGDRDPSWIIMDHGVVVGSYDDFASAVVAVRDYVMTRASAK
jgi:hypothetical protein